MSLIDSFGVDVLPEEKEQLRTAADALLFCKRLDTDDEARDALRVASDLVLRRAACGSAVRAVLDRLLVELVSCGPDVGAGARAA